MKSYRNLFNNLEEKIPPQSVCTAILIKVRHIESAKVKTRFIVSASTALVSFAGIIEFLIRLIQSSNQSGFFQYVSLIFSDSSE